MQTRWDDWNERMAAAEEWRDMIQDEGHESRMATLHEISEEKLQRGEDELRLEGHNFALWESEQEDWWIKGCPSG